MQTAPRLVCSQSMLSYIGCLAQVKIGTINRALEKCLSLLSVGNILKVITKVLNTYTAENISNI